MRLLPPALWQRQRFGQAVHVVTVVLRIDLHLHAVQITIVGDLDAGVVVHLCVGVSLERYGEVLATLEVAVVGVAAGMRRAGLVGAAVGGAARVEADVLVEAVVLAGRRRKKEYVRVAEGAQVNSESDEVIARSMHRAL